MHTLAHSPYSAPLLATTFIFTRQLMISWGIYFIAQHLDFAKPETLYNGFFPIGYPLLVRIMSTVAHPATGAYVLNVSATIALLMVVARFLNRYVSQSWTLFLLFLISFFPRFFHNITAPGPDIPAVVLMTAGMVLLLGGQTHASKKTLSVRRLLAAGSLFAFASLLRYHALIASFLFLLSLSIVYRNHLFKFMLCGVCVGVLYAPPTSN